MSKLINKVILVNVLVSLSFSAMSQTVTIPASKTIIKSVEETSYFNPSELTSPYVGWGVNPENPASINLLNAWKKFTKKKDVVVAVVDTGIDNSHPFLMKNIFVENGTTDTANFGVDFSKDKKLATAPTDMDGHGSHIAGIIRSINPEIKILALKYYDAKASGDDNLNSTIDALRYAVDHNVDIINYSAGGPGASARELAVLKEAEKKGILVVVAAGNKQSNIDNKANAYFPANYGLKNIIAVTAHDEDLNILDSSNYGASSVDVFAPGYRIKSSLQNGRVGHLTGTSQATAFVTGVASLLRAEYPNLSAENIKEIIKASSKKEVSMKGKCSSGGRLDAASALEMATQISGGKLSQRQLANMDN
ncbi:MAG: S8 family serine peptidase [Bdellovibrionales bacterium]|nr:S8 family serine peptidase [Bdellovibrionales bacterium]